MQSNWFSAPRLCVSVIFSLATVYLPVNAVRGDEVQMQNGDRYVGKVAEVSSNSLVLQSDILGSVQLPRNKVASITMGTNAAAKAGAVTTSPANNPGPIVTTNLSPEVPAVVRKLAAHTNLVQQVQSRFLADAGPEANAKFSELMNGLTTGKLSINDLRAEAKAMTAQARELRRDLDGEAGASLDMYLGILDKFLKESPAPTGSVSNTTRPKITPNPADE